MPTVLEFVRVYERIAARLDKLTPAERKHLETLQSLMQFDPTLIFPALKDMPLNIGEDSSKQAQFVHATAADHLFEVMNQQGAAASVESQALPSSGGGADLMIQSREESMHEAASYQPGGGEVEPLVLNDDHVEGGETSGLGAASAGPVFPPQEVVFQVSKGQSGEPAAEEAAEEEEIPPAPAAEPLAASPEPSAGPETPAEEEEPLAAAEEIPAVFEEPPAAVSEAPPPSVQEDKTIVQMPVDALPFEEHEPLAPAGPREDDYPETPLAPAFSGKTIETPYLASAEEPSGDEVRLTEEAEEAAAISVSPPDAGEVMPAVEVAAEMETRAPLPAEEPVEEPLESSDFPITGDLGMEPPFEAETVQEKPLTDVIPPIPAVLPAAMTAFPQPASAQSGAPQHSLQRELPPDTSEKLNNLESMLKAAAGVAAPGAPMPVREPSNPVFDQLPAEEEDLSLSGSYAVAIDDSEVEEIPEVESASPPPLPIPTPRVYDSTEMPVVEAPQQAPPEMARARVSAFDPFMTQELAALPDFEAEVDQQSKAGVLPGAVYPSAPGVDFDSSSVGVPPAAEEDAVVKTAEVEPAEAGDDTEYETFDAVEGVIGQTIMVPTLPDDESPVKPAVPGPFAMPKPPQTPGGLPNPLDFFDVPPPPNLPPQSAAALDRQSKFQAGMEVNASPLVDDLSGLDFSAATMQASAKEAATARQVSMSRPSAVNPDNPFAGLGGPVTIPRAEGANPFMTERIESSDLPTAVPGMVDSTPSAKSPFVTQPLDLTLGLPNPSRAKKSGVMAGPGRDLVVGSEMRKVAIHFQAGDIKRGFLRQLRSRDQSIQFFEQENGAASDVPMEGVKAVFVMEGKTRFQPPANMVPVTVTFEDGREIGGLTPDKDGNDSFLTIYPTQQRGMVERIFVLRSAVASMRDG